MNSEYLSLAAHWGHGIKGAGERVRRWWKMQNMAGQEPNRNPNMQYWGGEGCEDVRHSSSGLRTELYGRTHLGTISVPVVLVSYDQPVSENT